MIPLMVTKKRGKEIIESRSPKRTFLYTEDGLWVGIDNRKGLPEVKYFKTIKGCMNWLKSSVNGNQP